MRMLFWISALGVGYVYIGYPALLVVWARLRPRPVRRSNPVDEAEAEAGAGAEALPNISIVIAARNEAARLPARIDNLLALDYPSDRREIVVVSDGSTDDTLAVLSEYGGVLQPVAAPAAGKAAALNIATARATGDVLIFADARQMFVPDALRQLVAPLSDPEVGGVTGELLLNCEQSDVAGRRTRADRRGQSSERPHSSRIPERRLGERRGRQTSTIGDGVGLYWRYEKQLRRLESTVGSTLGATGAIYALRRSLYRALPENTILDDVLVPMRAVLAGHRVVFNERAIAFDRVSVDADAERRRKVRTLAGNFQILWQEPRLLLPVVNPVWLQYVSHKLGRLLVPYALVGLFLANLALAAEHPFYAVTLAAQCGLYFLGGYGAWLDSLRGKRRENATLGWLPVDRLARVALTFLVMNYAAVAGLASVLTRRQVWR